MNNGEGFTLTEMLVYVALLSIIIVGISSFLVWIVNAGAQTKVQRKTLYTARRTLETMTRDVKRAKTASTSDSRLILDTNDGSRIEFYLCGSTTACKDEDGTVTELTPERINVDQLHFTKVNTATTSSPSISIDLKVSYDKPSDRPWYQASVELNTTANSRSY